MSIQDIYRSGGVRGLLQGHLATLLRVFPYAGIKFMLYDRVHHVSWRLNPPPVSFLELIFSMHLKLLMPTKQSETSARLFLAGASSGPSASSGVPLVLHTIGLTKRWPVIF